MLRGRKKIENITIKVGDQNIDTHYSFKYLRVWIDKEGIRWKSRRGSIEERGKINKNNAQDKRTVDVETRNDYNCNYLTMH